MRKRVHVAVGVVVDARGCILVAKRPLDAHQGGLWEFPGGKVELNETVQQALARELLEELGVEVLSAAPLLIIEHDYGDKSVLLDVWWVDVFGGVPVGREGQPWQWVEVSALRDLEFPAANKAIVAAVTQRLQPA